MPRLAPISYLLALTVGASFATAAEFKVVDVPSIPGAGPPGPLVIAFAELRDDDPASPARLISFETWALTHPAQKQFLSPYPGYVEPTANITVEGVTKLAQEKLRMYVAEARFQVARPPATIDLARYATVNFLERLDPAIEHRLLAPADAGNGSNKNPDRQWCEGAAHVTCVRSKYRLEGKLPMAVQLVNQLTDDHKLFDYLEFQSELRILEPPALDQNGLKQLTGIDAPVTGAIEQTIFDVNQLMQFGKFLAVFQEDPADPDQTTVTAFIALALKATLLDKAKKYESVPVLRNLVPGMVLTGKSSFNAGNSISAGLPIFARNNLKAVAAILDGMRPACPSCFPLAACRATVPAFDLENMEQTAGAAALNNGELEPDLLQPCRRSVDPFAVAKTCSCAHSMPRQNASSCSASPAKEHATILHARTEACSVAGAGPGRLASNAGHAPNACCP